MYLRGRPRAPLACLPLPSPFAPSPPVGALASRSVSSLWLVTPLNALRIVRRPRLPASRSPRAAAGARLALVVPPSALAVRWNTLAAVVARHDRLFSLSSPWGLCCFSASPPCPRLRPGAVVVAVALVGLLGRVCCPPRHAARGYSRSRFARHSGCRFAPLFFRLPLCVAAGSALCFPSVRLPEVCHHAAPSDCPPDSLILRGLMPPAPPSFWGRAVTSRPPPYPLLGGVFYSIGA